MTLVLVAAREREHTGQRQFNRLPAHGFTVTGEAAGFRERLSIALPPRYAHRAYGLRGRAAGWTRDAADGDCDLRVALAQSACHHCLHRFFRDGAKISERLGWHAEHFELRDIGIGDEPAFVPVRTARHGGDRFPDPAA